MSKLPPERKYTLDEELFSRVLNSIISAYTIGRQPASSSLKAFYVVGQPAAGKTLLRDYLLASLGIRNSTIVCNTDDIRTHHPYYEDLLNNPDTLVKAPFLVNEDSSKLTDKLFQYAINNKYHVLIDATFGSQDLSHYFRQISTLLASGYSISFNVLAVHPKISYLSNYKRYLRGVTENKNERIVSKIVHDLSVKNLPGNIIKLSNFLEEHNNSATNNIFFRDQDGANIQPGDSISSLEDLSKKVQWEYSRPLTSKEKGDYILQCKKIQSEMDKSFVPIHIVKQFLEEFKEDLI